MRFEIKNDKFTLHGPDSRPFATYLELIEQRATAEPRAERLAARLRELGIEPDG